MSLAVIIPALNEAAALPATLSSLAAMDRPAAELIVVDGGSVDETRVIAADAGATIVDWAPPNRAGQMNAGAAAATADHLCFLHADTLAPRDLEATIAAALADPRTACGGFVSVMRGPRKTRWATTAHNYLKTYYAPLLFRPLSFARGARLLFGDQAMFCRRADFEAVGGFDARQAIMEEADLCLRFVREGRGRIRQIHRLVYSSDRRVEKWGGLRSNLTYFYIGAMWGIGAPSRRLARAYEDVR